MKKFNRHQEQSDGAIGSVSQMQKDMERGSPQKEDGCVSKWLKEVRFKKLSWVESMKRMCGRKLLSSMGCMKPNWPLNGFGMTFF